MQEKLNIRKFFLQKNVLMLKEKSFEALFRDQFKKVFSMRVGTEYTKKRTQHIKKELTTQRIFFLIS